MMIGFLERFKNYILKVGIKYYEFYLKHLFWTKTGISTCLIRLIGPF